MRRTLSQLRLAYNSHVVASAATDNNSPLRTYTLSPFDMRVGYELEQLRSMSGPQTFAATKDVGVLCYEAGAGAADVMNRFGTLLYDVVADPQQQNPIDDVERWLDPAGSVVDPVMDRLIVRDAFLRLPPEQSQILELAYFNGLTHREIAAALEIPEGTVKSRMRLGLEKMQRHLGGSQGQ